MVKRVRLDGRLQDWAAVPDRSWDSLLLGNGASIAVWRRFAYSSLLETADLAKGDRKLFDTLGTTDFEATLDALRIAQLVCKQAGHDNKVIRRRYIRIRRALVNAVRSVHVEPHQVPEVTRKTINETLRLFSRVYTTNYDLLLYWSIMVNGGEGFKDFFWGPGVTFDIANTDTPSDVTKVFYLHGALHLYRTAEGAAAKLTAEVENLLDALARPDAEVPLFVSEGRSIEKLNSIRRSDYLSFAGQHFARDSTPLIIFGHSLRAEDEHLIAAINKPERPVAISMLPGRSVSIIERKARLSQLLPDADLSFFSAITHPLGAKALQADS